MQQAATARTGRAPEPAAPPDHAGLDRLLAELHALGGRDIAIGQHADRAADLWRTPPRIQVTGRAHTGRTTVLHALALMSAVETGPIDAPGAPDPELDADIVVYVLAGAPQPADRRVLAALPPQHTVVVLNKADAIGSSWADAVAAADRYGRELRRPTLPVVASLATRTRAGAVTDEDLTVLRALATDPDPALTLSPDLFVAAAAGQHARARENLLRRWDLHGVACALAALRHDPTLTGPALVQVMHAASGIDALHRLLHRRYEQAAALRGGDLLDRLSRLAARSVPEAGGRARDLIEDYLAGDEAVWLGLCAGLAHPSIAHLAAGYPAVTPADADEALSRAARWRAVVAGDLPPTARRAALRVHNGYIRLWGRMSSAGF